MATHSSPLAWKIQAWMKEPGKLQSMGSQRVGHDRATSMVHWFSGSVWDWTRKWQPTPVFLPTESHRQRSLAGYSPWGRKKSDMTEQLTNTSVWEDASLWAHWIHSFHMHFNNLGGKSCFLIIYILNSLFTTRSGRYGGWLLLAFPWGPQQTPFGVVALAGSQAFVPFWEPAFTFGGSKLQIAVTFFGHWYGKKCFISQ